MVAHVCILAESVFEISCRKTDKQTNQPIPSAWVNIIKYWPNAFIAVRRTAVCSCRRGLFVHYTHRKLMTEIHRERQLFL